MTQDAFPERKRGHRLTANEWNDHCRELRKLRDIKGLNGITVRYNSGGVIIEGSKGGGVGYGLPVVATESKWQEIDSYNNIIIGGASIDYENVEIVGALGLDYPLYKVPPVDYNWDRRTRAILFQDKTLPEKYHAIINDFYQIYYVKCTDATYHEFTECDANTALFDDSRILYDPIILGDPNREFSLKDTENNETFGIHILVLTNYPHSAWIDAVFLLMDTGYAYYFE